MTACLSDNFILGCGPEAIIAVLRKQRRRFYQRWDQRLNPRTEYHRLFNIRYYAETAKKNELFIDRDAEIS